MENKFPNAQDAHMRLDGGIGLYKRHPVRIVMEGQEAHLYSLLNPKEIFIVNMNDEELITRSLPTGYCDIIWRTRLGNDRKLTEIDTVAFFARASHRKQKSVIHPSNLSIRLPEELSGYLDYNYVYTPEFGEMILGQFSENRDFTQFKVFQGQALSRNFAVLQLEEQQLLLFNEATIGQRRDYLKGFDLIPDYSNCLMMTRLSALNIPVN